MNLISHTFLSRNAALGIERVFELSQALSVGSE